VTGCTPISAGCEHCYAKRQAEQMQRQGIEKYRNGFSVTVHLDEMERPRRWKKPRRIFVCSMGDLFHERVPDQTIYDIVDVIRECPRHTFLFLTKRPKRMAQMFAVKLPRNLWVGTTVENKQTLWRLDYLRLMPGVVRFVSFEPLLEDVGQVDLKRINWVIVGGESGPGARAMMRDWVIYLAQQSRELQIPFFFKGWGGERPRSGGRLLAGSIWDQVPEVQVEYDAQALRRAR
jgi:protein gp37